MARRCPRAPKVGVSLGKFVQAALHLHKGRKPTSEVRNMIERDCDPRDGVEIDSDSTRIPQRRVGTTVLV